MQAPRLVLGAELLVELVPPASCKKGVTTGQRLDLDFWNGTSSSSFQNNTPLFYQSNKLLNDAATIIQQKNRPM